jgi:hypothetical protein
VNKNASAAEKYQELVARLKLIDGVAAGQMFGKPCLKIHGKAFAAQHKEAVVFKLHGSSHARAFSCVNAVLWDPSGKNRPMKEWIALTVAHAKHFNEFAEAAMFYVEQAA